LSLANPQKGHFMVLIPSSRAQVLVIPTPERSEERRNLLFLQQCKIVTGRAALRRGTYLRDRQDLKLTRAAR
jgi:hypothetical protein